MLDLLIIRALVRRGLEVKTVENLMGLQLIKGSGRLQVGKKQMGKEILFL